MAKSTASKKGASAGLVLHNCSIAISGTFPGTTQKAVEQRIKALGGTLVKSVAEDTTYLIATPKDYDKGTIKVNNAIDNDIPIVSIDWLEECESSCSKADASSYLLTSSPARPAANGKKRPASPAPNTITQGAAAPPANKLQKKESDAKVGDGQNAKSKAIQVPLDEGCQLYGYQVYIDDDGVIYDASLNQTNAGNNNNKFYRVQLLQDAARRDFKVWTRWGRVGEHGQKAVLGSGSLADALKNYEKKFKDKSGLKWEQRGADPKSGKYAYVERSYNPDSEDEDDPMAEEMADADEGTEPKRADCTLDKATQSLMQLIFNQDYFANTMSDLNYDANKLPLGKLSKATINRGFQTLKELATLFSDPNSDGGVPSAYAVEELSNRYYSLIPHDFGRNRPPVLRNSDLLKKEIELLESLGEMKEVQALLRSVKDDSGIHQLDRQFQGLGMEEMEPLNPSSTEFAELAEYLTKTKGSTHHHSYTVQDIFRIQRNGEFDRFQQSKFSKVQSNKRLLWHGSRVTNYGGILGQGLRIAPPEAPVSGYMFGKGIYLADMSSKSANYCCSYSSGGTALLLLCEAELGDPMQELLGASYNAGDTAQANKMYSTWGQGSTGPSKWKDAGVVHPSLAGVMMPDVSTAPGPTNVSGAHLLYNEYICYDVAQVRLRYLLRVKM